MFLVGLTGGIACGKSTVSSMLTDLGCTIIDADIVARQVVEPGKPAWFKIKQYFGDDILKDDETLDREKLGNIIFSDPAKRRKLNRITHPEIYRTIFWQLLGFLFKGHKFVILDLPLLYESGKMVKFMSKVIFVTCEEKTQIERLCLRNHLSRAEALQRVNAQMPRGVKCGRADYVVDNSGTRRETRDQVEEVYRQLASSGSPWKLRMAVVVLFMTSTGFLLFMIRKMSSLLRLF